MCHARWIVDYMCQARWIANAHREHLAPCEEGQDRLGRAPRRQGSRQGTSSIPVFLHSTPSNTLQAPPCITQHTPPCNTLHSAHNTLHTTHSTLHTAYCKENHAPCKEGQDRLGRAPRRQGGRQGEHFPCNALLTTHCTLRPGMEALCSMWCVV